MPERSSDVVEQFGMRALVAGLLGVISLIIAGVLFAFRGDGSTIGLIAVLGIAGVGSLGYAIYEWTQIKKVASVVVVCPYCQFKNRMTDQPRADFACGSCYRMIPVAPDGQILGVSQVRCGFCNHLNYYNETSVGLICESCDREIPISTAEGVETKKFFQAYTHKDDDQTYELVLISYGHKTEEVIATLQHMLALNRNQVKQMLEELPVTLLTGIPRKKAEMLKAQLALHDAAAEFHPVGSP